MRLCRVVVAWVIACSLVVGQADALDVPSLTTPAAAPGSSLFAADCTPGAAESAPLPPRPVLARSTFAADAPAPPAARKAILKKKTFGWKKKPSRRTKARRAKAARPGAPARPLAPAAKSPAKPAARMPSKQARPHARPPARPAPRRTLPKHAAAKARSPHRPAAHNAAPLRKLTYASPLCDDRAAVLQAFGVEDQMPSFGQELARAIEEAPDPGEPADASDDERGSPGSGGARNAFSSLASSPFSAFPGISNIGGSGPGIALPPPAGSGNGDGQGSAGDGGTGGQDVGPSGDSPPSPITDPVPEPASWATMILGFAAIGATLRRRSLFGSRA